jgi:hypothetical protein
MSLSRHWRRIVGGVAFVLAVAWLATRGTCGENSAEVTIRFRLGERAAEVRSIRAELHAGTGPEVLAFWEGNYPEGGTGPAVGHWPLRADAGVYLVEVEVRTRAGSGRISRKVELRDGASISLDVSEAIPPPNGPAAR